MKNEKGLTLVETLVVLAISSAFIIIAFSILASMSKAAEKTMNDALLRNETIYITQQLDKAMDNVDAAEISGSQQADGSFKAYTAVDKRMDETSPGIFEEAPINTLVQISGNDFTIGSKKINSDEFTAKDTVFILKNGQLHVKLIVANLTNKQKYEVYKIYNLQSE
ncbi:prepilin-type N-terminal cleavage/methylation domain-containing protein [Bacillus infantis]|uniref:prepilin-type N-terminal cleavage/methylation domain-containing protein n=1 Tax=Bacillus infantis TaxID=324767 RepID=UPI003CEE5467